MNPPKATAPDSKGWADFDSFNTQGKNNSENNDNWFNFSDNFSMNNNQSKQAADNDEFDDFVIASKVPEQEINQAKPTSEDQTWTYFDFDKPKFS